MRERDDRENRSRSWLKTYLGPISFFTVLTAVWTWPLLNRMDTSVVGRIGDNVYFIWLIDWFEKSLFHLHQSPLFVDSLNFPEGWSLASNEMTPVMVMLALPGSILINPVFGYNLAILLSFVLSGLGAYIWVKRLTEDSFAGYLAGILFAFSPYRYSHYLAGHLNLLGTQSLPFYFIFLHDTLNPEKKSRVSPILAATFFGLIGFTSQYYLYMTVLLTLFFVVGYSIFVNKRSLIGKVQITKLLVFGNLSFFLLSVAVLPYLQLAREGGLISKSLEDVRLYSASPTDFILPSTSHFALGETVGRQFDRSLWIEATLYLGIISIILALFSIFRRRKINIQQGNIELIAFFSIVGLILALGTDLHWLSEIVVFKVPDTLKPFLHREQFHIPLPGRLLHQWLPFYGVMRVSMRYGVFVLLGSSVLAGIGLHSLLSMVGKTYRNLIGVSIILFAILDFLPRPQTEFFEAKGRQVDYWLSAQEGEGAVVEIPFWKSGEQENVYYTMFHGKPYLGGYFTASVTNQYRELAPIMADFPSDKSIKKLQELSVQFVVISMDEYDAPTEMIRGVLDLGLIFRTSFDEVYVFELIDP